MKLDEYGRGRLSMILEMREWCEKEIEKIKSWPKMNKINSHASATMSGQVKAYTKVIDRLRVKTQRLKIEKT